MAELPGLGSPEYEAASERLRRNGGVTVEPDAIEVVRVYVCPRCGGYFGASSMGRLEEKTRQKIDGEPSGLRTDCQTPGCGGTREERYARLVPKEEVEAARKRVEALAGRTRPKLAASAAQRRAS